MLKKYLSTLLISTCIHSQANQLHEIGGNSVGSFAYDLEENTRSVGLDASYAYSLGSGFQLGASLFFASALGGQTVGLTLLPTYNLGERMIDAYFITPFFGLSRFTYEGNYSNSTFFGVQVGKRFALGEGFSYKPFVSFKKQSGSKGNISLNFLSFSGIF